MPDARCSAHRLLVTTAKGSRPGEGKKPNLKGVQPRRGAVQYCRPRMYRRQLVRGEVPRRMPFLQPPSWAVQTLRTSGPLGSQGLEMYMASRAILTSAAICLFRTSASAE